MASITRLSDPYPREDMQGKSCTHITQNTELTVYKLQPFSEVCITQSGHLTGWDSSLGVYSSALTTSVSNWFVTLKGDPVRSPHAQVALLSPSQLFYVPMNSLSLSVSHHRGQMTGGKPSYFLASCLRHSLAWTQLSHSFPLLASGLQGVF